MAGMKFDYLPRLGGFVPLHDEYMQSSIPGIYVAGDLAGIEEASSAMEEGKIAGIAAGISLGKIDKKRGRKVLAEAGRRLRTLRLGPYGDDRQDSKEKIIKKIHAD